MKRTLKKTLALVLSLVLALGLMAMGANAINDSGKVSKGYEEAVDVFVGLGLVQGDENGNFNPQSTFTREAAAKIICMMTYGVKEADLLKCSSDPFKDVKANRWSAGYISYCVSKGYIAGMGDGTFNPEGTITGYGFAKLLLCALGYDAKEEKLEGSEWEINTATLATKVGLFKGNEAGNLNAPATREECALYALNTLTANMVEYVGGTHVTVGGTTITTGATRQVVASNNAVKYNNVADNITQFCEQQFPALTLTANGSDDLGRTANIWELNGKKIATGAAKATYTYTVKADVANSGVEAAVKAATKNNKLTGLDGNIYVLNGAEAAAAFALKAGDQVEVFASNNAVSSVVVIRSTLVKVADIKALTAAQIKANANSDDPAVVAATSKVTLTEPDDGQVLAANLYNTQIPGFNYEKGQYALVVLDDSADPSAATEVLASEAAKTVTGTVDAIRGTTYRIGGTFYGTTADVGALTIKTEGTWALDAAGKLGGEVEVKAASSEYAYIYSIVKTSGTTSPDGLATGTTYTAYVVKSDGEKASYPVVAVNGTDGNASKSYITGGANVDAYEISDSKFTNNVYAASIVTSYRVNGKGELEVTTPVDTINASVSNVTVNKNAAKIGSAYATDSTKFVFVDTTKGLKISTSTGYKNVNIATGTAVTAVSNDKNQVVIAFVGGVAKVAGEEVPATLAVLLNAQPVLTADAEGKTVYTYSFSVDGADKDITSSSEIEAIKDGTITAGDVFTYEIADGAVTATKVDNGNTVTFVSGSQIELGTAINSVTTFDISGVSLYTITIDNTNNGAVSVEKGATLTSDSTNGANAVNVYTTGSGNTEKIVAIFVTNTISA